MPKPKSVTTKVSSPRGRRRSPKYTVTLTIGGVSHIGNGASAAEAIANVIRPEKITGNGILVITKGDRRADFLVPVARLKKLFVHKLVLQGFAKFAELRLG